MGGIVTTTEGALEVEVEVATTAGTALTAGADDEDAVAPVALTVAVTAALTDTAAAVGAVTATVGTIF